MTRRLKAGDRLVVASHNQGKLRVEQIFLLGCACPLDEMIPNEKAFDGTLSYHEARKSLTNSKPSLERTLPRIVAFADEFEEMLR